MSQRAWVAVRWAAGIGVVALLLLGLDAGQVASRIAEANGALVVVGVIGLTAVHMLGAAAWSFLCRRLGGLRLGWGTALRLYFVAQALGGVTPANIGGDAYRVAAVRKAGLGWSAAVTPVVTQRATSYLALAILALPALAMLAITRQIPVAILGAGLLLCGLAAGISLVLLAAAPRVTALGRIRRWTGDTARAPSEAGAAERPMAGTVAIATGFGLAFHASSVLLSGLLIAAVDPSAISVSVVAAIVVARLSLAVPFLPSGLGANEAILSLLFAGLGLAPQIALAGLLLGRIALLVTTVLGAGILLLGRQRIPVAEIQEARGAPVTSR